VAKAGEPRSECGVAKGKFAVPDTIDADEAAVAALFTGKAE
jgi:hypothetical protein